MIKVNWDDAEEAQDFPVLEPGKYLCELLDIEEKKTRNGDDMWSLQWEVFEGPHEGVKVFDNLVFSKKALSRAKILFKACGHKVEGEDEFEPTVILKKKCWLTVENGAYQKNGVWIKKHVVSFAGYEPVDQLPLKESATGKSPKEIFEDDDLPPF